MDIKKGLPYGWWKEERFVEGVEGLLFSILMAAVGLAMVIAWFGDLSSPSELIQFFNDPETLNK